MTDFEALIRRFGAAEIRFLLVGGFAGTVPGSPRTTVDLDMVYARDEENLASLAAALEPLQPRLRGTPPGLPFVLDSATLARGLNFHADHHSGDLDLLGEVTGCGGCDDLLPHTRRIRVFDTEVAVVTLPQLIRLKRAAGSRGIWWPWPSWRCCSKSRAWIRSRHGWLRGSAARVPRAGHEPKSRDVFPLGRGPVDRAADVTFGWCIVAWVMWATSISVELPRVLAWVAGAAGAVIAALLGVVAWFLRREMLRNETTNRDLTTSVHKLLEGNVEWIRSLSERVNRTDDKIDQVRRELTSENRSIERRLAQVEARLAGWKGGNRDDGRDRAAED